MAIELYRDFQHTVLAFDDLVSGDGVQSNQFLIIHKTHTALIDPGGDLTYIPLSLAIGQHIDLGDLNYVIASHQDPDIIASLDKWLMYTRCQIVISELWQRFVPHLVPGHMASKSTGRILGIPDQGMDIPFDDTIIKAVPAHFLHSVGNFSFYDPISKILLSGDIGASFVHDSGASELENMDAHLDSMTEFHQRYMCSNKACRFWVNMVRTMDVNMIVPQHGPPLRGKQMIDKFLNWLENLECGLDIVTQENYRLPANSP